MSATPQDQPSPEELQAYLESVRDADPAEILAQAFTVLGTGAEVKLGRPDARILIDAMAALTQVTEGRVPAQLTEGMRGGVSQLQTAQVQAEREAAGTTADEVRGAQQPVPGGSPAGADRSTGQTGQQQRPPQTGAGQSDEGQKMTDRLWIPGRGPQPGA